MITAEHKALISVEGNEWMTYDNMTCPLPQHNQLCKTDTVAATVNDN